MNELIQTIDCLTEAELNQVFHMMNGVTWEPSTIFGLNGPLVDKTIRSNERTCLDDAHPAAVVMHEAMNRALLEYKAQVFNMSPEYGKFPVPGAYRTTCHREAIQVLKYDEKEHYSWHYDQATDRKVNEYFRTISIVLYLKTADEGGRTVFPHRAFSPKPGQALIFPSNWCFPHSAEPVTKGQKIVAVTWYHSDYVFD